MKIALALAAPALLIAGTAIAQYQAKPPVMASLPYKALGTEPFWSVTIDNGILRYDGDGERIKVVAEPRPSFNGRRYVTPQITVDITRSRCSDGMSDRVYPDSVTVSIGRRTLKGCGGEPTEIVARSPIEGNWQITAIEGRAVRGNRPATIRFDDNRISGNAGCNSFGGGYSFARGVLKAGPLISTKMACVGPGMAQEQAVLRLLSRPLSVTTNPRGKLVLSAGGYRNLVLERR